MKTIICATLLALTVSHSTLAAERAHDDAKLDFGVFKDSDIQSLRSDIWWYSRYGKRCYHGPRYIRACH